MIGAARVPVRLLAGLLLLSLSAFACGKDIYAHARDAGAGDAESDDVDGAADTEPQTNRLIVDFERGPGTDSPEARQCMLAGSLTGVIPGTSEPCHTVGLTNGGADSCRPSLICDGCGNGGLCPQYLYRGETTSGLLPANGDYALRLHYWFDGMTPCGKPNATHTNGFSLAMFWLAHADTPTDVHCPSGGQVMDVGLYEALRMKVRVWHARGNLEVALQQENDAAPVNGQLAPAPETNPKVLTFKTVGEGRIGEWVNVNIPVCELLKQKEGERVVNTLNPKRITAVLVGVARENFAAHNFYDPVADKGAQKIDLDQLELIPCAGECPDCR